MWTACWWALAASAAAPDLPLSPDDLARVDSGETLWSRDGSAVWAARRIDAPADRIWAQITAYDEYVAFYPYVTGSTLDAVTEQDGARVYDCTMELTTRGIVTRYGVRNTLFADEGWMQIAMLPSSWSPLHEATGYWVVAPSDRGALVVYRLDVDAAWWIPEWVRGRAAARGAPTVLDALARRVEASLSPEGSDRPEQPVLE